MMMLQRYGNRIRTRWTLHLPDEAWWDDFYTPMETRIAELRGKYAGDVEASAILDQLAEEPEMHRRHLYFDAWTSFRNRRPHP